MYINIYRRNLGCCVTWRFRWCRIVVGVVCLLFLGTRGCVFLLVHCVVVVLCGGVGDVDVVVDGVDAVADEDDDNDTTGTGTTGGAAKSQPAPRSIISIRFGPTPIQRMGIPINS
jgi:hypothetical protein